MYEPQNILHQEIILYHIVSIFGHFLASNMYITLDTQNNNYFTY